MPASHCNRWWRVHPAHPLHSPSQSHPTPGLNHRLWPLSAVGSVSFEFSRHFHRLLARSLVGRGKPGGGLRYVHCAFEQFFRTADCCGITRIEIWQDEDYNEFKLHIFSAVLPLPLLFLYPCSQCLLCVSMCVREALMALFATWPAFPAPFATHPCRIY